MSLREIVAAWARAKPRSGATAGFFATSLQTSGGVTFAGLLARAIDGERLARVGGPDSSGFGAKTQAVKLRVLSTAEAESTKAACWCDDQSNGLGELFLTECAPALSAIEADPL